MRLKAAIFIAGAAVQWLRGWHGKCWTMPAQSGCHGGGGLIRIKDVYLVPSLCRPWRAYWDAEARGAIFGC